VKRQILQECFLQNFKGKNFKIWNIQIQELFKDFQGPWIFSLQNSRTSQGPYEPCISLWLWLRCIIFLWFFAFIFTTRCTLVQSAVLRPHVMSVRQSGTWVDCDHIGWNCSEIISPIVSLGCTLSADPNSRGLLQGVGLCSAHLWKFWPKETHPLLIWASETLDCKLRPNGYR